MKLETSSAYEIGNLVNLRKISAKEVLDFFFNRIETRNPIINAFVYTKYEDGLKKANMIDNILSKSTGRTINLGPFAGVPVGLKDFLPSKKGWTNSHGGVKSLIMEDTANSTFYDAISIAGGYALGKTNAPHFGFSGLTDNKLYGPTLNPFNLLYNSGGSSGGSAAAVSAGLVPLAEGGDAGGSIRIPASWCNCYGFKPSVGTVPNYSRPDGWSATHPFCAGGGITKSVKDAAILLRYMSHYDSRDPYSNPYTGHIKYDEILTPIKDYKIAYTYDFGLFPSTEYSKSVVSKAKDAFRDAGYTVQEVAFNFKHTLKEIADMWCKTISIDTAIDIAEWKKSGLDLIRDHRDELSEEFIYWNEQAANMNIFDMRKFNEIRTDILDQFEEVFDTYDLILSPISWCPPLLNQTDGNTRGVSEFNGEEFNNVISFAETFLVNFIGYPAASIPTLILEENNLPMGVHMIGKKYQDEDVLCGSYILERENPWNYDNL